jgi:hypothetical protein
MDEEQQRKILLALLLGLGIFVILTFIFSGSNEDEDHEERRRREERRRHEERRREENECADVLQMVYDHKQRNMIELQKLQILQQLQIQQNQQIQQDLQILLQDQNNSKDKTACIMNSLKNDDGYSSEDINKHMVNMVLNKETKFQPENPESIKKFISNFDSAGKRCTGQGSILSDLIQDVNPTPSPPPQRNPMYNN